MKLFQQVALSKAIPRKVSKPVWFLLCAFMVIIILCCTVIGWFSFTFANRFTEGIYVDSVNVSGLTLLEAEKRLQHHLVPTPPISVTLQHNDVFISSTSAELGVYRDTHAALMSAFEYGKSSSEIQNLKDIVFALYKSRHFVSSFTIPVESAYSFTQAFEALFEESGTYPQAQLDNKGEVLVKNGEFGETVDTEKTVQQLLGLPFTNDELVTVQMKQNGQVLSEEQLQDFSLQVKNLTKKSIELVHDITTIRISDNQLIDAFVYPNSFDEEELNTLVQSWEPQINRQAQNAMFEMDVNSKKVLNFSPHRTGRALRIEETTGQIISLARTFFAASTQSDQTTLTGQLIVEETLPEVPLEKVNPFGIKERIGFGESFYHHSIPSRIHNVSQASKIVNNAVVMAGDEFSFNETLGEVSKRTGFKPAYVIRGGATVLGDGGGVCQVSTTLFRALLDAGLEITRRLPHSYRVSYYEINNDPGFDATVYSGNVDLRFRNDTNYPVLLHFSTYPEKQYMTVEIFGVSDGRTSKITEYKKWDARKAPASVYSDDPTLPAGKVIQVDWAVGGIKAKFRHTVTNADGTERFSKEYYSNYIPWSAKFRRGTGS